MSLYNNYVPGEIAVNKYNITCISESVCIVVSHVVAKISLVSLYIIFNRGSITVRDVFVSEGNRQHLAQ